MVRFALCAILVLVSPPAFEAQGPAGAARQPPPPPPGYIPPPLNPNGVTLETRRLADGVYALVANTPFTDNSGFVVGSDAVLVVDSQFNGRMGRQVLDAVHQVTDKPIRYLVNTNAFGDHTFGNYVFPRDTQIVASRLRRAEEHDCDVRQRMASTVGNDLSVFDGVELRLPDIAFDEEWSVDLGGRRVEARFFGQGMSPNDTVVYVPGARVAWTGNLIFGAGTIPWAQSRQPCGLSPDARSPVAHAGRRDNRTGPRRARRRRHDRDVSEISRDGPARSRRRGRPGVSFDEFVSAAQIPAGFDIAPALVPLMTGFHRWNLQRAYIEAGPKN